MKDLHTHTNQQLCLACVAWVYVKRVRLRG